MTQVLESLNDDTYEPSQYQVSNGREGLSCCKIILVIFGSLFILLGIIDMIVFYVIPNNQLKQNKKKYPNYEFDKPDITLIAFHFLEHFFLILTGIMMILGIIPDLPGTLTYILPIIFISLLTVTFYTLQVVFTLYDLNFIDKEDFTLSQLSLLLNNEHPINSYMIYVIGKTKRHKGGYYTCYSKGGISLQVESNLSLPHFDPNKYEPDFLYIIISQNVNTSDELIPWFDQAKEKVISCENKHSATGNYHPFVEGKNFISNGKKVPSKYSKGSAFTSAFFGVGVYYELLKKSIPIKRFTQNSNIYLKPGFNYNETILNTSCSSIGSCQAANDIPR
ncbi:hypothetical protein M9Y10_041361 [Tritrichomonas musculus]|uniref:Uncharacterized protein n=1 Tax=Tritrichomonas musculus TaxID=1915356 RepID=A0ABR2K482_9EUKA